MPLLRDGLKMLGLAPLKELEAANKTNSTLRWALDEMRRQIALEQHHD